MARSTEKMEGSMFHMCPEAVFFCDKKKQRNCIRESFKDVLLILKTLTFIRMNCYISETALPITETKKRKHFAIQTTPQNLGKLTSEPAFAHSKVLFRPLLRMKRTITLSDACARFKRQRFQN